MASMFDRREQHAQKTDKYTFASSPSYQDYMKSSKCTGNDCKAAAGSAQSRNDSMGCFRCEATNPTTHSSFGLATTRDNDSTGVAAGVNYNDSRLNQSVQRYPSPFRHTMHRKRAPSSHIQQPQPDAVFESKTPFYDQSFQSFSRF